MELPGPFWLIGCGNMAGAMLRGWLDAGMDPAQVTVIRPSGAPVADGVRVLTHLPLDERPVVTMLGVKPQMLDDVATDLAPVLDGSELLISILAGVEQASLRARFPGPRTIVRAMPNTPVALRKGATSLHGEGGAGEDRALAERLMATLGHVEWIADEALFDVVAALTASGPAFVFRFIDALAAAASGLGLSDDQARRLALATVEGASALAAASDESPHQLAERVASPGGMTRKGLDVLDADESLNRLVHTTLEAAVRRSREMGEAARRN
ncbi:pyrroline-5-carboxylate reductase [Sphingosinicella sp. YJ22]|uniref:pyrroline-5-carboxylate reductase n=1 Tax=Sphingosinicella sp. YJ22 TaxID=1104780 RepID=UPI00140BA15D|nr:pyrroline-5-carboxylate reductase [Sphingosinicella sp. YJ22]